MCEWVGSLDLPEKKAIAVEHLLEELGVTKPFNLADLTDANIDDLLDIIPQIKKTNFKNQLAIYRPNVTLSLLAKIATFDIIKS